MLNARIIEALTGTALSSASDDPYAIINEWLARTNAYAPTDDDIMWFVSYVTDIIKLKTTGLSTLLL